MGTHPDVAKQYDSTATGIEYICVAAGTSLEGSW